MKALLKEKYLRVGEIDFVIFFERSQYFHSRSALITNRDRFMLIDEILKIARETNALEFRAILEWNMLRADNDPRTWNPTCPSPLFLSIAYGSLIFCFMGSDYRMNYGSWLPLKTEYRITIRPIFIRCRPIALFSTIFPSRATPAFILIDRFESFHWSLSSLATPAPIRPVLSNSNKMAVDSTR